MPQMFSETFRECFQLVRMREWRTGLGTHLKGLAKKVKNFLKKNFHWFSEKGAQFFSAKHFWAKAPLSHNLLISQVLVFACSFICQGPSTR